jgi:pyridoxal phosphate enzyme (YggS family)
MDVVPSSLADRLERVKSLIAAAASTSSRPISPTLIAVSKTKPVELFLEAYSAGQRLFGESYVQEVTQKAPFLPADAQIHFIGHLQSNKAKALLTVPQVVCVQTVDSSKLASALEKACCALGRSVDVMIQVNACSQDSKSGVPPTTVAVAQLRDELSTCPHLHLTGLMTIGSPEDSALAVPTAFETLRELRDAVLPAGKLSMGMTADMEAAVRAGSDFVRIGTAIFGERDYSTC